MSGHAMNIAVKFLRAGSMAVLLTALTAGDAFAGQSHTLAGAVRDASGSPLPGVVIDAERRGEKAGHASAVSDPDGRYTLDGLQSGTYRLTFRLLGFATRMRDGVRVEASAPSTVDVTLQVALSTDVTVTAKETFVNLAELEAPEENLVGMATAASQGAVTAHQIATRPLMRAGEVLETVPGLMVSQHSGEGKANQYYLRGFNLDHGTDFATTVAGVPVNMPTHGHGHGYTDVGFLIPELVSGVQFKKGPYHADEGDFSAAGAASIAYMNSLERPLVSVSAGQDGWGRVLAAASPRVGQGTLLAAVDANHNDGPWERGDDYRKVSGVVRYTRGTAQNGVGITGMAYDAQWRSTDQAPQRAIDSGRLSRFGLIDDSDGGSTSRYSVSLDWQRQDSRSLTRATAYALRYSLDLFSNFTYFLDDPENGDQFEQRDRRFVGGGRVSHRRRAELFGRPVEHTLGAQLRSDAIGTVGLYKTSRRQRLSTVREDDVWQTSAGVYAQSEVRLGDRVRAMAGLRGDLYRFRVDASDPRNSGIATDGLVSPKGGLVLGPWAKTELYVNAGMGFHSNDARGATITVDPATGLAADRVTPLVRARGAELGLRTVLIPHVQSTVAFWRLDLDSELLFVGDAGTTEAGRPSRRYGVEWTNFIKPRRWLTLDADLAFSRARFTDDDPAGARIPGAVGAVVSAGATVEGRWPIMGSLRWRYFGGRPLLEDDSVRSEATSLVNLDVAYRLGRTARLRLDVFNLFDARVSDVDYFYASRLPGEPAGGVDDIHTHPSPPRTVRVALVFGF
jgi:hypothetical protein